ncbi:DUF1592 domain-containing protein [Planctomicrobium sp. SH668]|uniref:DUF1592 domain-containing protein n=1 Tax=Planctomicrobium sp. SH668 TaxID=3448126 RepID=UPI003F5B9C5A
MRLWFPSTLLVLVLLLNWAPRSHQSLSTLIQNAANAGEVDESTEGKPTLAPVAYETDLQPFVMKYCSSCHADGAMEGGFYLDPYKNLDDILENRAMWSKLVKLVEIGAMPPAEADQPSEEERQQAVDWLNQQLYFVDCNAERNPGRVTIRRLNKVEYNNTVNALLSIDFKPADSFPSDDTSHGFDNIGDVLSVPPLLIEKYLAAAEEIADAAAYHRSPIAFKKKLPLDRFKPSGAAQTEASGISMVSSGAAESTFRFPRSGSYLLRIMARQDKGGNEDAHLVVSLDGEHLETFDVANTTEMMPFELPINSKGGHQTVKVAFDNDFWDEKAEVNKDRNLFIATVEIEGPTDLTDDEKSLIPFTRIMPDEATTATQAATENLTRFLPRAFRRPVSAEEVNRYVKLVEMAIAEGATFEEGMGISLQAILISPDFLFRVEGGRRTDGNVEMLDDFALASRLSYFLWSAPPDDILYELASQNRLHEPDVLREQTERMLKDPRTHQLVKNFAGQWLGLRKLTSTEVNPDKTIFPEFTKDIRLDLWKETELFFGSIVEEDRSIFDLLSGRFTFLNERLANYYGIEGITGKEFRRVELEGLHRSGVLTQGSVLTLTSFPNRTSPVKRGEWVLAVLLGDAPPPPPPSVPTLEATTKGNPNLTFRESLALHTTDPNCASCHKTMDAIGFGLDNFDAIGRWRAKDGESFLDTSGELPSGEKFNGPDELIEILSRNRNDFSRNLTEKLLTYAIGRGVEWYDRCEIDEIISELEQRDQFSVLIHGIVNSAPFQSRKLIEAPPVTVSGNP